MPARPVLSLVPDGRLISDLSGTLAIERGRHQLPLGELGPGLRGAVEAVAAGGATEQELIDRVAGGEGGRDVLRLHQLLADLTVRALLCRGVRRGREPFVTVVPWSRSAPQPSRGAPPEAFILSRFASLRRADRSLLLESPLAHCYLILHGPEGAALLSHLASPSERAGLAATIGGLSEADAELTVDLLWEAGVLSAVDPDGRIEEDEDADLACWEPHDLLFHARSRAGRHRNPYGGTYPFAGAIAPPKALKAAMSSETIALFQPDVDRLMRDDPPFSRVLEERRSRRLRGDRPVTLDELGELLYRSCRLRRVIAKETHEISERVYPGGGAVYELEIYPVVGACEGLAPGLYHYEPGRHRLERLGGPTSEVRELLAAAGQASDAETPEILLVVAARFQRVTWKYRSMAYAGILKNVGVLYQTIYLVATAMGLSACALGGGDSDLFARAAGTRYEAETSVGELILNRGPSP